MSNHHNNDQVDAGETGPPMTKFKLVLFVALTLSTVASSSGQEKEVIGYYPSWKWRYLPPDKIPFSKLTSVNYAFFYPLPDGHLVGRDTVDDAMILGRVEW